MKHYLQACYYTLTAFIFLTVCTKLLIIPLCSIYHQVGRVILAYVNVPWFTHIKCYSGNKVVSMFYNGIYIITNGTLVLQNILRGR